MIKKWIGLLLWVVCLISTAILSPAGCTNIQIGQTSQRFYDNFHETLKSYSDFSPTNPNSFSFAAMGDTHIGSNEGNLLVKALQESQADGDEFAVIAGDDSNTGQTSELNGFESQIARVTIPVYPAIGNHDIFFGGWNNYKAVVGHSIYSFNAGVAHFIFLDTANGTLGEEQLGWLEKDLKNNTNPVKIVVQHFPVVFAQTSTIYKLSSDEESVVFKSIMHKYGVQLVLSGHYHGYSDRTVGGTRYIVSGACNDILDIGNQAEYVKVIINNNQITTKVKNL